MSLQMLKHLTVRRACRVRATTVRHRGPCHRGSVCPTLHQSSAATAGGHTCWSVTNWTVVYGTYRSWPASVPRQSACGRHRLDVTSHRSARGPSFAADSASYSRTGHQLLLLQLQHLAYPSATGFVRSNSSWQPWSEARGAVPGLGIRALTLNLTWASAGKLTHQDALLADDGADGLQHARVLGRQLPRGAAADPPDRLQLDLHRRQAAPQILPP